MKKVPPPDSSWNPTREQIEDMQRGNRPQLRKLHDTAITSQPARESLVEQRIVRYLKSLGTRASFMKAGFDGWPDRIICYKGYFIGVEIKSERLDHEATERQLLRIRQIRDAGGIAIVTNAVADVEAIVKRIDALEALNRERVPHASIRPLAGQIELPRIDEVTEGAFHEFAGRADRSARDRD